MNNQDTSAPEEKDPGIKPEYVTVYPYSTFSYDNGFADGVLKLGESPYFATFSENLEKKNLAESLLQRCRNELAKIGTELSNIKTQTIELYATVFEREEKISFEETRLNEALDKRQELEKSIKETWQKRESIDPEYSIAVAFIMLLVGFVFIGADIWITQGIMEDVLSMKPMEAWVIAISISFTAFAIKPAIDRIFEKPLRTKQKVLRNNIMLIVIGILIVAMLGFLGYFRIKGIDILIGLHKDDEAHFKKWIELINSPTIIIVFTIASILFAVVGALCLSIGFKCFEEHFRRYGLLINGGWLLKKRLKAQEGTIFNIRESLALLKKDLKTASTKLELLPAQQNLEMRLAGLQIEEKDLMMIIAEANTLAQIAWYREGAARGERFTVSGDLFVSPIRTERWVVPEPIQGPYSTGSRGFRPRSTPNLEPTKGTISRSDDYLYQQIRNAIALQDNKSNKKHSNNGKHN